MDKKYIELGFALLLSTSIFCAADKTFVDALNVAIDNRDANTAERLCKLNHVSAAQKERFKLSATQRVNDLESRASSLWRNAFRSDNWKAIAGLVMAPAALYASMLTLGHPLEGVHPDGKRFIKGGILAIDALVIWLIAKGFGLSNVRGNLYKARRVLEAVNNLGVE